MFLHDRGHTDVAADIVADGTGLMNILYTPDDTVQALLLLVTDTESIT